MKNEKLRVLYYIVISFFFLFTACSHATHMIEGPGVARVDDMSGFLVMKNSRIDRNLANEIALLYLEEARAENINQDVAFAQMCIETGYLSFGGAAGYDQNNFCGLGVTSPQNRGESFNDMRLGVRAHIQHLKAYATTDPPKNKIVDPRFNNVKRGSAIYVFQLTGKWATDPSYGTKIDRIASELMDFSRQGKFQVVDKK